MPRTKNPKKPAKVMITARVKVDLRLQILAHMEWMDHNEPAVEHDQTDATIDLLLRGLASMSQPKP